MSGAGAGAAVKISMYGPYEKLCCNEKERDIVVPGEADRI